MAGAHITSQSRDAPPEAVSVAGEAGLATTNNRKRLELPHIAGEKWLDQPAREGTHLLSPQCSNPTSRQNGSSSWTLVPLRASAGKVYTISPKTTDVIKNLALKCPIKPQKPAIPCLRSTLQQERKDTCVGLCEESTGPIGALTSRKLIKATKTVTAGTKEKRQQTMDKSQRTDTQLRGR